MGKKGGHWQFTEKHKWPTDLRDRTHDPTSKDRKTESATRALQRPLSSRGRACRRRAGPPPSSRTVDVRGASPPEDLCGGKRGGTARDRRPSRTRLSVTPSVRPKRAATTRHPGTQETSFH
ncbi:uncharacterized protein LOC113875557 isoform X2 [Bos indicus x Bos taurus]|uniref:uncharacterized protein LOC113875557 isoform X2 n=1 Tax=Bos indicus x Bos taurus TaxID=30522 RepID=UPI0000EBDBE3|nr:uncharacterized protein LOC113875557 isoform X2 [Bos indicus x Bos taurus]DAA19258.1 TPA: hypothetical protein BOS_18196 [Bos taurus]